MIEQNDEFLEQNWKNLFTNNIEQQVTFDKVKDLNDTTLFLKYIVPIIGKQQMIESAIDENLPDELSTFKAFFVNSRQYIIGN